MLELTLDREELRLLAELVESRIHELHPTIRRSRVYQCTEELKQDLEVLERLRERLEPTKTEATA